MGEVYRAKDTKLKRDVALKVLPAAFARDPDRMARFQREAEVLASLNHPNIAAIYGVEHADGMQALAMEMVEGESPKGPLGFDEAWHIASQIAGALEYAHDKGVIHRDLKPANVKVTPDGVVKLLDFGLAKAFSLQTETRASGNGENSPTLTMGATEVGMILGTAAYMSPEQARGKAVDTRADIWSFGVVLYELLTGERLFQGEDAAETLAAVIQKQPDLSRVPAKARRLLERCLEKDPKRRLRDIGDAEALLVNATAMEVPAPSRSRFGIVAMIAMVVLLFALVATSWALFRATRPAELKPLVRLDVDLGPNVSLGSQAGADAILSPDGTRLVYVSQGKLFTRKLDQPEGVELAGTEGAFSPFFSPDGKWVAFFAVGKLKKLSVEGGAPVVLVDAPNASSGTWGEDGNIIASFSNSSLSRIPSAGGTPTPVTELAPGEFRHNWPQVLPGGKALLFSSATSNGNNIDIVSLKDGRRKILQKGGLFGRYVPTSNGAGHLMYVNNGTLFAVAFDLDALEVRGTPVPVLDQVAYNPQYGSAQLDFSGVASGPGTLLYRRGGATASKLVTVQWLDSEGKMQPLLAKPGTYTRLRLSPDGQRLALEIPGGSSPDIWIYEGQRDTMTRLTFDAGTVGMQAVWSPDGRYIVFAGKGGVFWTRSDGSGTPQPLTQSKNAQFPNSFTPDGSRMTVIESNGSGGFALLTMALHNDSTGLRGGKPEVFLQGSFDVRTPMFSPDGRWLAYSSNESGNYQVYVRAFPAQGGKWLISNAGGLFPVWSHNGRELFFRSSENRIMVASYIVKGDSFVADQPRVWSEKRLAPVGFAQTFDVAPDGKRIAVLMPVETPEAQQAQNHVVFLINFFDELRRKVPLSGK